MFRKLLALTVAALMVAAFSAVPNANAAPVSGSLQLDIVITPDCGDVFSPLFGFTQFLPCPKVTGTFVKVEADLALTLSISGLDITSTSVFTFKGIEFEALRIVATVGALTVRTNLIFAPSVWEIEQERSTSTLTSARYCINFQNPGDVTPPFLNCPAADGTLFFLLEDVGVYHPIIQNLILAVIADGSNMLDGPLYFIKKVVDLNLNIAGLVLSIRGLFANLGTATTPSFNTGLVLALEGQTVSGITVRAETYFGARQGLECFAECKPVERTRGGKVVKSFTVQEEKLFIRNLTVAGITNNIRAEFQFFNGDLFPAGLTYFEWNQRFRVAPWNLSVSNTIRFDGTLVPRFDFLQTSVKVGDLTVTAFFLYYLRSTGTFEAQLAEFVTSFDPPGVTVTSDLTLCTETLFVPFCSGGVDEHDIYLSAAVGNFTFDARFIFFGLFNNFSEVWFDLTYKLAPGVDLANSYVIDADSLEAFSFRLTWKF